VDFGAGTRDAHLYRIDGDGQRVWEKTYGGSGWDSADCITRAGDGGYVAAGYSTSYSGNQDVYVIRVDGEGNKIWENTYGTPERDSARDIIQSGDGGYLVLGSTESTEYGARYVYVLKINDRGEKVWDKNYDHLYPYWTRTTTQGSNYLLATEAGDFIIVAVTQTDEICVLRIDQNGQIIWEKTYGEISWPGPRIAGNENRFLVTSRNGPTFMIDGEGKKTWETNYTNDLKEHWDNLRDALAEKEWLAPHEWLMPSSIGGETVLSSCGGFILTRHGPGGDIIIWRIDEKGRIIWSRTITNVTYPISDWGPRLFAYARSIALGTDGKVILAGQLWHCHHIWCSSNPYIILLLDSNLSAECAPHCQDRFPQLWDNINSKLPLAQALIDNAKRKGTDTTIISLIEQELQNAKNAQKMCDLDSAVMHLDWIIQAAPEPHIFAVILLMPFCWAWKRTKYWYN
jgi:hypothetical protein